MYLSSTILVVNQGGADKQLFEFNLNQLSKSP